MRLDGKVAIITGGARGMGAATARLFAAHGAKVVIADVLSDGQAVATEIGEPAIFHFHDVSNEDSWRDLNQRVEQEFGPVHILVNNAGVIRVSEVIDQDLKDFEFCQRVNLIGTFLGIKTIAPAIIKAGGGSIINISSTEGLQGTNGLGAYAASKWGVRGLTKVAAMELSHRGVRVNSVHPGPTDTPMGNPYNLPLLEMGSMHPSQPLGRVGRPDEIAKVSLFLASDDSSYMTGAELAVDGGMSIGNYLPFLPGLPPALAGSERLMTL